MSLKNKCWYILLVSFIIPFSSIVAQDWPERSVSRDSNQIEEGHLNISQDPRLDDLLQRHINYNQKKGGINGYRIQIFFGSGRTARDDANETKAKFLSYFPDVKAHILYQSPFYKVRVGDFRTKNETLKFYRRAQRRFPNAYIIQDIIEFPELD
jgi:mRNA-degrading endonuclease RelE of RelBE toxin-antitoxin system